MKVFITHILFAAATARGYHSRVLVLGPIGCGAFDDKVEKYAFTNLPSLFADVLTDEKFKFLHRFKEIHFCSHFEEELKYEFNKKGVENFTIYYSKDVNGIEIK